MKNSLVLSVILASLTLLACQPLAPSAPLCRTTLTEFQAQGSHLQGAVGCVIRTSKGVALWLNHNNKLDLPRISPEPNESYQCAAHRSVWEASGLNVVVDKIVYTDNELTLFQCNEQQALEHFEHPLKLPEWVSQPNSQLVQQDPFHLDHSILEDPDLLVPLRDAYVASHTRHPN